MDSSYSPERLFYIFVITLLLVPTQTSAFLNRHLLMFLAFVPGIKVPIAVLLDVKRSPCFYLSLNFPTHDHPSAVPSAQEDTDLS